MDIFRFLNPTSPTKFEQGVIINGLTSAIWIERYREPGEFTLKARIDSDLRNSLPIGSFISHVDTNEIMIVENLEINNDRDIKSEITFTGRSFETFLENRVVGANRTFPRNYEQPAYALYFMLAGTQAKLLIEDHILPVNVLDPKDGLPYVSVLSTVPGDVYNIAVNFDRKELYPQLLDLLALNNLGIKSIRPNIQSPLGSYHPNTILMIHKGQDLSNEVKISNDYDDIENADYFWSNRKVKNTAMVTSKWFEVMVKPLAEGYSRRVMFVDGKHLDELYDEMPTEENRDSVLAALELLGQTALLNQKEIVIRNVNTTRPFGKYKYGVDFNCGDIVTIVGDYSESAKMRVIEHVRVEDETGRSEYPTLAAL